MADHGAAIEDVQPTQTPDTTARQDSDKFRDQRTLDRMPADEAAKESVRIWKAQDIPMRRRQAGWRANVLRREGITNVRVTKDQDQQIWRVWSPPGVSAVIPTLNKAARLCRRLVAVIFADPAIPEATPSTDEDDDRASAETTTRVLQDLGSENQLDNNRTARLALGMASTHGSGFRRFWVDPKGGGWRPLAITASQQAPAVRIVNGRPVVEDGVSDPQTDQAYPEPYVKRYVLEDGTLVDDPTTKGIRRQWLPKLKLEILTGDHVRLLPIHSRDIWAAEGAVVGSLVQIGELRRQFPDVLGKLDAALEKKLEVELDDGDKALLPPGLKRSDLNAGEKFDERYTRVLTIYYRQSATYPTGYYGIVAGDGVHIHRQPWWNEKTSEPLDIPIDQMKQLDAGNDPYGGAMMSELGPGNEIRAASWGSMLEYLDRFNNRRIMLPLTSTVQPHEMQAGTGTVLYFNPGGKPELEPIPDFPKSADDMEKRISLEMDDESGLQQQAQAMNAPSVQSGLHAQRILEQVQVGLSDIKENASRCLERGWRIQLQLIKAYFDTPQTLAWVGDDNAHVLRQWKGSDLFNTKDVRIQRGSFTGLTPSAKAALAESFATLGVIDSMTLKRIAIGNVGGLLGIQDDAHWQRIRRQIEAWRRGPSEEATAAASQAPSEIQPFAGPQLVPEGGEEQQPEPPPSPVTIEAQTIFEPVATDEDPAVAAVRHAELGRTMASVQFSRWAPEWRQPLEAEFLRMRAAAGVQTMQEQSEAAQAQQDAEQQAAQAQQEAESQAGQTASEAATAADDKKAQDGLERENVKAQSGIERARIAAQPSVSIGLSGKITDPEPSLTAGIQT